ncbi:DUF3558 domain-containing protein [Amycolatopsis sp. NBC_01480]|uniref:DUF3558 domain-containing protein n=1 Tax=Amycolatopsis sp. NBC_01480 TaxID=2903562 RepID=UPI002E2A8028|nr:DUF3558 domain-containing protein [Amycolatopsis sp. NBC_01480]
MPKSQKLSEKSIRAIPPPVECINRTAVNRYQIRLTVASAASVGVVLVGGCSGSTPGTANPAPPGVSQSGPSTSTGSQNVEAPKVSTPLTVDKFLADPCSMLTPTQLSTMQLSQPKADSASSGIGCGWRFGDGYTAVSASFLTTVKDGLTNAYRQKGTGYYKDGYFEPTVVSGFPAVLANTADRRDQGQVTMLVGLSDQTEMLVLIQGTPGSNATTAATNVTKAILSTVQGAQ